MAEPPTESGELRTLINQTSNALIRLDERVGGDPDLQQPIGWALAALEAARSTSLDSIHHAARPVAAGLILDDPNTAHPTSRTTQALHSAHTPADDRGTTRQVLDTLNTQIAASPVQAARLRLHPAEPKGHDDHAAAPPHPDQIEQHLADLTDYVTEHLPAHPISTTAIAVMALDHITPYAYGSETTARTWSTALLDQAFITTTIPAPLATGLTETNYQAMRAAYTAGRYDELTAHTAQALLTGAARFADYITKLHAEADHMKTVLEKARTRCNSLTWTAANNLLGHPVTSSSHIGAVIDSDRFTGYNTINKLTDVGILEPDGDTHHATRVLDLWNSTMKPRNDSPT